MFDCQFLTVLSLIIATSLVRLLDPENTGRPRIVEMAFLSCIKIEI